MNVLLGDIVKDLDTGCRGVVIELEELGAWVDIDPLYLTPEQEEVWFLPYERLIRI